MRKAFTLIEVLLVVAMTSVVMLSLLGIFRGSIQGLLMVSRDSVMRQLDAFDMDVNLALSGIIPKLPDGYVYLYLPPDRENGLLLFVVTSYSENGVGVSERSYWLKGEKLYVMESDYVDGRVNDFEPERAHLLVEGLKELTLYMTDGKKRIKGGIYREYNAIPHYLYVCAKTGTYEVKDFVEMGYVGK